MFLDHKKESSENRASARNKNILLRQMNLLKQEQNLIRRREKNQSQTLYLTHHLNRSRKVGKKPFEQIQQQSDLNK